MKTKKRFFLLFFAGSLILSSCNTKPNTTDLLSVKMANSVISRNPEAWMLDFCKEPKWGYCHGVVGVAMLKLAKEYNLPEYYNYMLAFTDTMIREDGKIWDYNPTNYNIDRINSGKMLFDIYKKEQDSKYLKALMLLRQQLETHPRTSEGGFWHKQKYPHQMWLDGLYMGTPFYAQYAKEFNDTAAFTDIANQFNLVRKHIYDSSSGLYRHGWDESHTQQWADSVTGLSQNVWGRGVGWLYMALVDVLDFFPKDHNNYADVLLMYQDLSAAIIKYQDSESGSWCQVMDMPGEEGNYLEATASSMFTYGLLKGLRKGYLDESFKPLALKAYYGFVSNFIEEDAKGNLVITNCCAGAGLGGDPYRDGTYEYYINETVRNNDPKAVGPFIMACIEIEKQNDNK